MVIDFELTSDLKLMIDGVFTSLVIGLSYYTFHQYKLERRHITSVKGLRKKLTHFYNCLVRSYLYLVIGGCISVIGYLITYGKLHIVTFVVLLVLFSLKRPTLKMIVEDLELVGKELDVLRNKEEIEI